MDLMEESKRNITPVLLVHTWGHLIRVRILGLISIWPTSTLILTDTPSLDIQTRVLKTAHR